MGTSAQNSSGVHLCRRRVRFNEVPEKVLKVPKVWEALVQPGQVQQGSGEGSGRLWCRAIQQGSGEGSGDGRLWCSQVRFNRVPEKVLGGFGAERFNRVLEKVPEKVWDLVLSQVRFNRVPEKVPEKVWEALVQSQVRFNRVPEKVPEKVQLSFRTICKNKMSRLLGIPPKLI